MIDARAPRSTTIRLRGCATVPPASAVVTKSRWTGRCQIHAGRDVHHAALGQERGVERGERRALDRRVPGRGERWSSGAVGRGAPRPGSPPGRPAGSAPTALSGSLKTPFTKTSVVQSAWPKTNGASCSRVSSPAPPVAGRQVPCAIGAIGVKRHSSSRGREAGPREPLHGRPADRLEPLGALGGGGAGPGLELLHERLGHDAAPTASSSHS